MVDELNMAIAGYQEKWRQLLDGRTDKAFFEHLRPTSVGWKTKDQTDFDTRFDELRALTDQIHLGWVNERWIATIHLKEATLVNGLTVIKLMQRRPGSTDATGLDHLDFYFDPGQFNAKEILKAEPDLQWNEEMNGEHCKWLSIWFAGTEAKIRSDTVIDVCVSEMDDIRRQLLADKDNS